MCKIAMKRTALLGTILGAAALAALPISLNWSPAKTLSLSLDKANARIGNPLSPGSIAGVNRRVNRRAARRGYYGYGGGYGAAAVGAGVGYYGGGYAPGVYRRAARRAYVAGAVAASAAPNGSYGGLYNSSPAVNTTSPVPLDAAQHTYCLSRTFDAGPC